MIEPFLALLFGLLIGSFLNVCIYRWPRDLSVVRPRSHCVACGKTIIWYDNIPVVSWLVLQARCRHCGARISWRYPAVELLTGLAFFYFVSQSGVTLLALKMCAFSAMLIALTFTDLEERILPDELTLGGITSGLVFAVFVPVPESLAQLFLSGRKAWLLDALMGAVFPALILWATAAVWGRLRQKEVLGLGDVKLIAMVGSFLGLRGALLTLAAGSLAGSLIGLGYILVTRKDWQSYELPFGTFLGFAALGVAAFAS
ncbi:MAG: prepilin peptidase [Acidobacteriia bacterium]|nr:prepilin peptidase [Terriglobia bacterium]